VFFYYSKSINEDLIRGQEGVILVLVLLESLGDMMICERCKTPTTPAQDLYHFVECGLEIVYLRSCKLYLCRTCGAKYPLLPLGDSGFYMAIAEALTSKPYALTGEEFRFLWNYLSLAVRENERLGKLIGFHNRDLFKLNDLSSPEAFIASASAKTNDDVLINALLDDEVRQCVARYIGLNDFSDMKKFEKVVALPVSVDAKLRELVAAIVTDKKFHCQIEFNERDEMTICVEMPR